MDVTNFLFESGAKPNARDTAGQTAIERAQAKNNQEMMKLLQSYQEITDV